MNRALAPRGLRARTVLAFAVGALVVSAVLVVTTFVLARSYLLDQRERGLTRQAYADANLLRSRLATAGTDVSEVLDGLSPPGASEIVVRSGDAWFSSSLDVGARDVPASLQQVVAGGEAGTLRVATSDGPRLAVGVPVVDARVDFYELSPLTELQRVLRTLAGVLAAGAAVGTAAGAALGVWASRRVVRPLEQVAGAATRIAGGELTTRLPVTRDPDLIAIVGSFNSMVEALTARIERDARFVGDVSHELRSPLTGLVTSVEVMAARQEELTPRAQQALAIVEDELARFRRMLDDLLELARAEAAVPGGPVARICLAELVREVLVRSGRTGLLATEAAERTVVEGDKLQLERAVSNLVENADRHGGGVRVVRVRRDGDFVVLAVEDAGPGVPREDRERVFERFVRGPRSVRGSLPGAGLGLAIVAETARRLGGGALCTRSPEGGARFVLTLPAAPR